MVSGAALIFRAGNERRGLCLVATGARLRPF